MRKDNHPISLRVSEETLSAINEHREDIPLTQWLRDAINLKLQTGHDRISAPDGTTKKTTLKLQERLSSIEARLSKLEGRQKTPTKKPKTLKPTQPLKDITQPELEPVNGVVNHKIYRSEIDNFVMQLVTKGYSHRSICDYLNNLGWLTTSNAAWTRNAVGAITRRLKDNEDFHHGV